MPSLRLGNFCKSVSLSLSSHHERPQAVRDMLFSSFITGRKQQQIPRFARNDNSIGEPPIPHRPPGTLLTPAIYGFFIRAALIPEATVCSQYGKAPSILEKSVAPGPPLSSIIPHNS